MANKGITAVMQMTYRGAAEEWSQTYHFTGGLPADPAAWHDLAISLGDLIKTVINPTHEIIRFYGYSNTDNPAIWSEDLLAEATPIVGEYAIGAGVTAPGDAAVWARWKTSRNNTHGKPVYLRKYFHGVELSQADAGSDSLMAAYRTALSDFATNVQGAFNNWPGLAGPAGDETFLSSAVSQWATTRTLERRGKRP